MKYLFIVFALIVLSGCASKTIGTCITNISSDGKGNLIIEKSNFKYDTFSGLTSIEAATTTTINVIPSK